ncbi:MAG: thermonuclease family protein [Pseudomonadota bacterium]
MLSGVFVVESLQANAAGLVRRSVVVRVIDGDTFAIAGGAKVRVRNFDTPELRRYACAEERSLAMAARDAARVLLQGKTVALTVDGRDRYGRLVADVTVIDGTTSGDFAQMMIDAGYGAPWDYGAEPQPEWCAEEKQRFATLPNGPQLREPHGLWPRVRAWFTH